MIKAGTRVSNPKGNPNSGFEFTKDYYRWDYHNFSILKESVKPFGSARSWGSKKPPKWLTEFVISYFEPEPETPSDYAWSEHVIPVVYKLDLGDRVYSIEDDENLYHVQLATLSDGEYFMRNILTTRWLWIARAYTRLHGWLA